MITNRHNNCILQPESVHRPEKCASPAHGEGPAAQRWEGLFRTVHRGGGKMLCELKQS